MNPSETIAKKTVSVQVGEETIVISTFSFAKSLKLFGYVAELTQVAQVAQAVNAAGNDEIELPAPGATTSGFISTLLDILPVALRSGAPVVYRILGLLVTSNREFKQLERGEQSTDEVLERRGDDIANDCSVEEVMLLVSESLKVVGIESVVKAVGPLVKTLGAAKT